MTIEFYGHPFSSYCMKALIAFYENDIPFEWRVLSPEHPENGEAMAKLWPIRRFPTIVDGDTQVIRRTTTQPVRSIKGQRPRTAAPLSQATCHTPTGRHALSGSASIFLSSGLG